MTHEQFDTTVDTEHLIADKFGLTPYTRKLAALTLAATVGLGLSGCENKDSACESKYTVLKGETMSEIAIDHDRALFELDEANPEIIGHQIRAGQTLIIPGVC